MPFQEEQHKCNSTLTDVSGVFSMGRAGSYLYGIDIDDCIHQTLILREYIESGSYDHPVQALCTAS